MVNFSMLKALSFATWASMATAVAVAPPVNPEITLCDVTYESTLVYSARDHLAVSEGAVQFKVNNSVLDYSLWCFGRAGRFPQNFYGDIVYDCEEAPNGEDTASFMFSRNGNHIMLNQTWVDEEEKYVYT
jgi:hypothetical protein